jgi:hypothetical protein
MRRYQALMFAALALVYAGCGGGPTGPTPLPEPTKVVVILATPSPTATPTTVPTATPAPTPEPTAEPAPAPAPPSTPTPAPTPTPTLTCSNFKVTSTGATYVTWAVTWVSSVATDGVITATLSPGGASGSRSDYGASCGGCAVLTDGLTPNTWYTATITVKTNLGTTCSGTVTDLTTVK